MVIKSFKDRVKARMGISAAELDDGSKLQVARLGVSVVSNDAAVCHDLMDSVRSMASNLPNAILADYRSQVFSFGKGGSGLDLKLSEEG